MPLYEYHCRPCNVRFELIKHRDMRCGSCPKCGQTVMPSMSVFDFSVGWRLSERSHERFGPREEYVKDF
jgi:putative FmdB family regulatory protein